MRFHYFPRAICLFLCLGFTTACFGESSYIQNKNIVYGEAHGVGLVMDIFVPKEKKNGMAIIDVVSGAWFSNRGKIKAHKRAQLFEELCKRGFVVFAIRPGSLSKFTAKEMLKHIRGGIKWVKAHSGEYKIDPNNLGLVGFSAGGHLASLTAVTADDETRVAVAAVFFPPTDLFNYGDPITKLTKKEIEKKKIVISMLTFGLAKTMGKTPEEIETALKEISPAYLVTKSAPPFFIIHGDADEKVPLSQSLRFKKVLEDKGVPIELIIKKDGGHPWPTIHEEVVILADWLLENLSKK